MLLQFLFEIFLVSLSTHLLKEFKILLDAIMFDKIFG
jgi:hypothetical protein